MSVKRRRFSKHYKWGLKRVQMQRCKSLILKFTALSLCGFLSRLFSFMSADRSGSNAPSEFYFNVRFLSRKDLRGPPNGFESNSSQITTFSPV